MPLVSRIDRACGKTSPDTKGNGFLRTGFKSDKGAIGLSGVMTLNRYRVGISKKKDYIDLAPSLLPG